MNSFSSSLIVLFQPLAPFSRRARLGSTALLALALATTGVAQVTIDQSQTQEKPATLSSLSVSDAIQMALKKNGTIAVGDIRYRISKLQTLEAFAAFLPTLTPNYTYNSNRQEFYSGGQYSFGQTEGGTSAITATWRLLDLGERQFNYLASSHAQTAQYYTDAQTYRQTLYNVEFQYIETLRAQEIQKVSAAQVTRAQTIYDQTKAEVANGSTAAKDLSQAAADLANAQVQLLQSQNGITTSAAQLKSLIGYNTDQLLPTLSKVAEPNLSLYSSQLDSVLSEGLANRPDLMAERENIKSLNFSARYSDRLAGISLALDTAFTQSFTPHNLQDRVASLSISYPLFDGGRSRNVAKVARLEVTSAQKTLEQDERVAKSEIETAYLTLKQNGQRVIAAQAAQLAAQTNYNSVEDAYRLGASTLLDVLTAQVSLVTAESNLIQATYDYDESDLQLKLDTGKPLADESSVPQK